MRSENESTEISEESDSQPPRPQGFQWNLVGWFGSSIGASLWMLITPFFLSWPPKGVFAGIVATLVVWTYSSLAWAFREKISAFRGLIGEICLTVLASFSFLLFAHANELPLSSGVSDLKTNYGTYYLAVFTVFVSLLFFFWVKEHKAQK